MLIGVASSPFDVSVGTWNPNSVVPCPATPAWVAA